MTTYKDIDLKELVQVDLLTVQKIMKETLDLTTTQQIMCDRGTFDVNPQLTVSGGMQGKNIYQIVVEQFSQGTRNTPTQIQYLEALEKTVGLFRTTALELRKEMDVLTLEQRLGALRQELKPVEVAVKKPEVSEEMIPAMKELSAQITEAVFFSNRYALSFAGYVGLGLLGLEKAPIENLFSFGTKYDQSKDRDDLTTRLTRVVSQDLLRVTADKKQRTETVTDEDMKLTLQSIFTAWTNQFNWDTFKATAEKYELENVRLQYGTYSMIAGAGKRKHDVVTVDEKFMDVHREDVIGSQELGERLWSNFLKLAAFDPERKKNPYDPASVIFTYGEPGGGKTFTAHAYVQSFAELCREKGVALWALTHSTTDYASHYQNKTANELSALAGKIKEFPGVVVMYVADADNIFLSRKNPQLTAEQQQTLGVYFKMFDGTMVPKNGKFLAVMDANYLEGIDDATKSRLFDEVVEVKRFNKVEDFAELARRTLTSGLGTVGVADTEWKEIGEYLLPCPLSNREIGHVIKQLRRGFNVPQEMIGRSYEEHVAYRNSQLQGMTKGTILGKFEEYVSRRMEIERASYESRRRDDTERFMEFLAAKGQNGSAGIQ